MGDPRKLRKIYERPRKAWEKDRIETEKKVLDEFGLKNKREMLVAEGELRRVKRRARALLGLGEKAAPEVKKLADRLVKFGLIKENPTLDDILSLEIRDMLSRRLETFVFKMGLARSYSQARQFISHGHIAVNGKRISAPGYIVKNGDKIDYYMGKRPLVMDDVVEKAPKVVEAPAAPAAEPVAPKVEGKSDV